MLVANPGCYPTAATLPLVPLLHAGLVTTDSIVVDAVSAARVAPVAVPSEHYSLVEMHDNVARVQSVVASASAGDQRSRTPRRPRARPVDVTFVPKILPIPRGILATITTRLRGGTTAAQLTATLRAAYDGEPFVRVYDRAEDVDLHRVVGTNVCAIAAARRGTRVVLVSAIDNLVKGAAGQALQNANLMLGLPETTGLLGLRRFHP